MDVTREQTELEKGDLTDWPGGLPVGLDKKDSSGLTLEERLSKHVKDELDKEESNQLRLTSNIKKWQRQYKGKKRPKSRPWNQCANIAVPLTRVNIDTVFVRIVDAIFNRRRPIVVKAKKPEFMDLARQTEEALDWLLTNVIKLRQKLLDPLLQQLKIGTAVLYLTWETKNRTIYRYSDWKERLDPRVKKYKSGSARIVKDIQTIYEGPNIYPVPRENFVISSDAADIDDAYIVGFRKNYRKSEIDVNVKRGVWRKEGADKILSPDAYSENEETRADNQSKDLEKTDWSKPYEVWTLWIKFDVDGDGEPDDIMVTIHQETGAILRAIYTPTFTGQRPFVKLVGYPTEYAFDGEGYCEVLYHIQEEVDTIHNQRLDRMSLINSMMTITKSQSGLENFKIEPGKNYVCDDNLEEAFREIKFSDQYPSTFNEESQLIQLADKVTGNTPALQGTSLAERPVFRDTQTLLSESNKKFKSMIDHITAGITEAVYQLLELYSQYEPRISYKVTNEAGKMEDRSVTLPITAIRDGLDITLAAATEVTSQESRREMNNNLYMLLSDAGSKMASVVQAMTDPNTPVPFKKFLLSASHANAKFLRDVLLDSDRPDADELCLDLEKIWTPEEIQEMLTPPPPPPQQGPPGGPPGGQPPGMPPEGPPGPPEGMPQGGPPPGMPPEGMM